LKRSEPPTPALPGIEWAAPSGSGHRYARVALEGIDSIPRGVTTQVFLVLTAHYRAGVPIRITNASLARQAKCHVGSARVAINWLKSHIVPGRDYTFITVGGDNENRVIWMQCRPVEPGEHKSHKQEGARASAQGGRAPARAPVAISPKPKPDNGTPFFLNTEELNNVNVKALTENPPASARETPDAEVAPTGTQEPCLPETAEPPTVPPSAPDAEEAALRSLDDTALAAHIAALALALASPMGLSRRIELRMSQILAQAVLGERRGSQTVDPPLTPRVPSIEPPRPVAPTSPPPKPDQPPRQRVDTLVDRLRRVAGPAPVEELAQRLAEELADAGSIAWYRQTCGRVQRGELQPAVVWQAYRQARSPTARSPGAVFTTFVLDHGPPVEKSDRPGSPTAKKASPTGSQDRPALR
jgi:hypothetical protein